MILIKTVGELKQALEKYQDNVAVRTVFDACGNLYFPHIVLNENNESDDLGRCLIIEHEMIKF